MLRVQQLTELEEIVAVKRAEAAGEGGGAAAGPLVGTRGRALMQAMWNGRLKGVQRNVEVWQHLLRWVGRAANLSCCLPS
jgi:hypothetical protein